MPERTDYQPGTFSWVDLSTSDLAAAQHFYAELLGWEYDVQQTPMGPYVMALKDGKAVAGMGPQPEEQKQMGIPSMWNSYVTVASADDTAAAAARLGANVIVAPMDAMDAGRTAFIAAPGGEVLGVWEPRAHIGAGLVDEPGTLTWNELATRDLDTAITFYRDLFGWDLQTGPNPGGSGEYTVAMVDNKMAAGLMAMDDTWPADIPPYWAVYLSVANIEETTAKAKDLGGQVIMAPMEIPTVGIIAVLQDPTGAVFSALQAAPQLDES